MAIAGVQKSSVLATGFADTGDVVLTGVAAGALLVVWIGTNGAGVTNGNVNSSNGGGTAFTNGARITGSNGEASIWYLLNAGSGSHTVTINPSGGGDLIGAVMKEYSGVATSSALDGTPATRTQSGTTAAATNGYTTTNADDLLVALCVPDTGFSSVTLAEGGGFSLVDEFESGAGSGCNFSATDKIVAATGTYTPTWTLGSSCNPLTVIMAFKAAAGGGGGATVRNLMMMGLGQDKRCRQPKYSRDSKSGLHLPTWMSEAA